VLTEFVKAGAPDEILYVSKPHIGTFRWSPWSRQMRAEIESLGGEIRFGQRVEDVEIETGRCADVAPGGWRNHLPPSHVVLAVGHSARDTFRMLHACRRAWRPSRSRSACASSIRSP
jgi:uncharacterized FAD-dependent dehydrogenase